MLKSASLTKNSRKIFARFKNNAYLCSGILIFQLTSNDAAASKRRRADVMSAIFEFPDKTKLLILSIIRNETI